MGKLRTVFSPKHFGGVYGHSVGTRFQSTFGLRLKGCAMVRVSADISSIYFEITAVSNNSWLTIGRSLKKFAVNVEKK